MSLKNICTTYAEYLRVNISTFSTFFNIIYYKTTNDRLLWDIPAVVVVGNPLGACSVSRAKEFRNFLQQQQTMEKCSGNNYNRKWRGGGRGGVVGGFFGTVFWTIAELEKLLTELRCTQLLPMLLLFLLLVRAGRYFRLACRQRKQRRRGQKTLVPMVPPCLDRKQVLEFCFLRQSWSSPLDTSSCACCGTTWNPVGLSSGNSRIVQS